jgi:hypothetical protein
MAAFGPSVFLSAFLLFAVQPLIGKALLPWFGGSRPSGRRACCSSRSCSWAATPGRTG